MRGPAPDDAARIAAMSQHVKMHPVGLADAVAAAPGLAAHGGQRLDHRIGADEDGRPGRDLRIARRQQDAERGEQETAEIGAAVAKENLAHREIDDEEPEDERGVEQGQLEDQGIADPERDPGEGAEHDEQRTRREAVEPVDDVDRIRDSTHREAGKEQRDEIEGQQPVDPGQIDLFHHVSGQQREDHAGDHGGEEPPFHPDRAGEILAEAGDERRKAGEADRDPDLAQVPRQQEGGEPIGEADRQTADARDLVTMELLRTGQVIVRIAAVPPLGQDQREAQDKAQCERRQRGFVNDLPTGLGQRTAHARGWSPSFLLSGV